MLIGNRGGIPTIQASQSNAGSTTTNAVYTFPDHTFRISGPAGLIIATFDLAATTVLGVNVTVNGQSRALTNAAGEPVTEITAGDHLITFNRVANTLKLIV